MRITNKRVLPPKRDPRTGDTIVWRESSNERQEKPKIKVTSRDKPSEAGFRRPPSKIRGNSKNAVGLRAGHSRTIAAEEGTELRVPSQDHRDPFKRTNSRSGKLNHVELSIMNKTSYKGRTFQLKKDKQLYDKVWNNREEEHNKNTPTKPNRFPKEEQREKPQGSEYKLNARNVFYINEGKQRNSNTALNDISMGHQERRTLTITDSHGNSTQKQKPAHKLEHIEERQMFRIKSKQQSHHHTVMTAAHDEVKDIENVQTDVEVPSEKIEFDFFEADEEQVLTELKSHLTNLSNPQVKLSQNVSEEHLKICFCQPTWVRVWRQKKFMGQRLLEEKIIGILIYQLDSSHFKSRRLLITHYSVQDFAYFDQYLREAVDHIFQTDHCTEIHMQFNYVMDEGKLVIFPELKESVKKAGLKWRMVMNNMDGSRVCVFEAKRNPQVHGEVKADAVCHEPLKQLSFALLSECPILNERGLLRSDRMFRGMLDVMLVPYDRTFLTFAAFLRFIDYKCSDIASDKLRNAGKYGDLILNAKSKPVRSA